MKVVIAFLLILVAFGIAAAQTNEISRIKILGGGEIRLADESLGTVADLSALRARLTQRFHRSREVVVEADESLSLSVVLQVLRTVRDLRAKPLHLKIASSEGDFKVMIPVSADADEDVANLRPNPLTLVVRVGADDRLSLNGDLQKSQQVLLARLRKLFHQRKKMKAWRPGSNEIEATLFLKPDPALSFTKAIALLRALHSVGANPLGLQIDDLGDGYSPSIGRNRTNRWTRVPMHRDVSQLDWSVPICRD